MNNVICCCLCICLIFSAVAIQKEKATFLNLHIMSIEHYYMTHWICLSSFISRRQSKYPQIEGNIGHFVKCLNPEIIWRSTAAECNSLSACFLLLSFHGKKWGERVIRNISVTHVWNGSVLKLKGDRRCFSPHYLQSDLGTGFAYGMQGYICSTSKFIPHFSALCHPIFAVHSPLFPYFSLAFPHSWQTSRTLENSP